jgi:TonB family protein
MLLGIGLVLGACGVFSDVQTQTQVQSLGKVLSGPEHVTRYYLVDPVKPKYPESAQQASIEGEVLVFVRFDKDGKLVETKILRSPDESLSNAVLDALKGCQIKPHAPLYPEATFCSELRFIFSLKSGNPEVSELSEEEQLKVSKEFNQEMQRRMKKPL